MASLLRDSSFGQIVRLLSANKLFRFPDEVDPSLSTKFAAAAPLNGREGGVVHSASRSERPSEEEQQEAYDDGDNYVVDWYGEADPEVRHIFSPLLAASHIFLESPKLAG